MRKKTGTVYAKDK